MMPRWLAERGRYLRNLAGALTLSIFLFTQGIAVAESPHPPIEPTTAVSASDERILGLIPNYQTVSNPKLPYTPLSRKQKWALSIKETIDPFNVASAAMGAGLSQLGNETPKYGHGGGAYGKRFGAALGDFATQNLFSAGLLASALHQDPRYFRKGPQASILNRVVYSVSRVVITKNDSGRSAFNASGVFGMALGIAASNVYYPSDSIRGSVMAERLTTSITGGITGNLLSEFWPDLEKIEKKLFHRKN
jgi:hypothetical protein